MSGDGRDRRGWAGAASPLEWVVAAASALLVAAATGYLLWDERQGPQSGPVIVVEVDSIVRAGAGYRVDFRARNEGSVTVAGLVVEGEVRDRAGEAETSQATFDYLPARGTREGGLFFSHDPREGGLAVRPLGYELP